MLLEKTAEECVGMQSKASYNKCEHYETKDEGDHFVFLFIKGQGTFNMPIITQFEKIDLSKLFTFRTF